MPSYIRTRAHQVLLAVAFLALQMGAGAGQPNQAAQEAKSQSPATLRTNTRLVVVDVVATDSKGQPVPDLKAEDFTVLEDGKPQQIANFVFERSTAVKVQKFDLPPNIVTNAPPFQSNSLNVILFDTVNGEGSEHAYARDQLLKFLNGADLGRPVAIFALENELKLLHDFTTDNKALLAAVTKYRAPVQAMTSESIESRASAFTTRGDYHTSERGIDVTLNQLHALAKTLKGYSGRKNLIWLSESFPLTLFPESVGQLNMSGSSLRVGEAEGGQTAHDRLLSQSPYKSYAAMVKKVSDELMAAQVAVYPVDAGALGKDEHLGSQHTMEDMASRTGGRAFKNANDLSLGLRTSIEDGSTYYTLAYYPENKHWDGQFRIIQIKSRVPGANLRYRQGYYALDPEKLNQEDSDAVAETFSRSLRLDAPAATAVIFQVQVVPPTDKSKKVVVNFHVDPTTMAFEHKADGSEYAKLSCTVWAYGKDRDKPTMSSGTVNANLPPAEYQQIMRQHFVPCGRELDLKPGTYALRMGVLDRTTNKIGTASATVTVP